MRTTKPTAGLTSMAFLLALLVFPSLAAAERPQDTAEPPTLYLEIHGFTQGMGQGMHPDELPIDAMLHELTQPFDPATGASTGHRLHSPLRISKPMGPISPMFPLMVATMQELPQVKVRFYRTDPSSGSETHYYMIFMEGVRAVDYGIDGVGGKKNASEGLSFVYERITWTDEISGLSRTDYWRSPGTTP